MCRVRASFCTSNGHADGVLRAQSHHSACAAFSEGSGYFGGETPPAMPQRTKRSVMKE